MKFQGRGDEREREGKRLGRFDGHKYRSNYAAANWKLNTLGVDGVGQRTGASLPAVLRERKLAGGG